MAAAVTFTGVPRTRTFAGGNPGARYKVNSPSAHDLGADFADGDAVLFLQSVVRDSVWWVQFDGDLNDGARADLRAVFKVVSAGTVYTLVGDISAYATEASRGGANAQANFAYDAADSSHGRATAVGIMAGATGAGTADVTFSSASSGGDGAPLRVGGRPVAAAKVGERDVTAAYLGSTRLFGG